MAHKPSKKNLQCPGPNQKDSEQNILGVPASTEKRVAWKDVGRDRRIPVTHPTLQNCIIVENQGTVAETFKFFNLCSPKNIGSAYFVLNEPVTKQQKSLFVCFVLFKNSKMSIFVELVLDKKHQNQYSCRILIVQKLAKHLILSNLCRPENKKRLLRLKLGGKTVKMSKYVQLMVKSVT